VPDEAYDTAMDDVDLADDEAVAAAGAVNWAIGADGWTMGVMGRSPGETTEQWSVRDGGIPGRVGRVRGAMAPHPDKHRVGGCG
jgi:hypothetical protein